MIKILNTKRKQFLTTKGIRVPKYIWQSKDSKGETYIGITKKDLTSQLQRIERLRIKNPELFLVE